MRIKKYIAENPSAGSKDEWVRGIGWDQTFFGRMPTAVSRCRLTSKSTTLMRYERTIFPEIQI